MSAAAAIVPVAFGDLPGWADDDHAAAFAAFRLSAAAMALKPPTSRPLGPDGAALAGIGAAALAGQARDAVAARAFFERYFHPAEVRPETGRPFFTGYYEPEIAGARTRTAEFTVPFYSRPPDLIDVAEGTTGLDPSFRFARSEGGRFAPYFDRAAIVAGALAGRELEIAWVADPVDAFFAHIQGSARIRLAGGDTMRLTYAAKSGHPYTAIGRVLLDRGGLHPGTVSMATIRAWLAAYPGLVPAVLAENRSYIFFQEAPVADPLLGPVAAAGVALTPARSLAVDRTLHTFHSPVWVEADLPAAAGRLRRLMIAQDTGSAIVGPARGDIFFGAGDTAGAIAGAMQSPGRFVLLLPRADAP